MENIAISVIVPVYNVEKYIERCLDSICNQTFKDLQIILIDDCSTDSSLSILKKYQEKDERITVIMLEKNSGAAVARNKGLEVAKGEYLSFIDSDDDIEFNFYENLYQKAKETNAEVVKCKRRYYNLDGTITYSSLNEIIKQKGNLHFGYEWTSAIYKASLIFDNNITFTPELIKAQDIAFLNKIMLKTTKPIELIGSTHYNYRRHSGSLNGEKIPLKSIKSAILSQIIQCEDLNNSDLYEKNKEEYIYLYFSRINSIFENIIFQNDSFESKEICAQGIIKLFKNNKDEKAMLKIFLYKKLISLIKKENSKQLAKELYKIKNLEDLRKLKYRFYIKIFGIKISVK